MRHLRLSNVITRADMPTATFGAWDGNISILAVMLGLHASAPHALALAGLSGTVGGMFSMATGQYESEAKATPRRAKTRRAVVMGTATAAGGVLPVVGFLTGSKPFGYGFAFLTSVALATGVWLLKREGIGGALRTYALLLGTIAATWAVGLA